MTRKRKTPGDSKNTHRQRVRMPQDAPLARRPTRSTPRFESEILNRESSRGTTRLRNPTSSTRHLRRAPLENHRQVVSRVKAAVLKARKMQSVLKSGDEDALVNATLLQGILSGDVTAASFKMRARLQRENMAMRRRLTMSRIKTEQVKQRLLTAEADRREKPDTPWSVTVDRIREVYGLAPMNPPLLPAAVTAAEIINDPL